MGWRKDSRNLTSIILSIILKGMKKNDENKEKVLGLYFDEHKTSSEIVEMMNGIVSRPTVFLWIRQEKERRTLEAKENGEYIPLRERAFENPVDRIRELEKENSDLKSQVRILTLALERLLKNKED